MATKSKAFSTTSSNFGAKGWVIMILTFFSILLMSNICYDSLNVTIPEFGTTFAVLAGVPGAEMEGAIGGQHRHALHVLHCGRLGIRYWCGPVGRSVR